MDVYFLISVDIQLLLPKTSKNKEIINFITIFAKITLNHDV